MLRPDKRPRPIVLRMNVGDCLQVKFENLLADIPSVATGGNPPFNPQNLRTVPDPNSATSLSFAICHPPGRHTRHGDGIETGD